MIDWINAIIWGLIGLVVFCIGSGISVFIRMLLDDEDEDL